MKLSSGQRAEGLVLKIDDPALPAQFTSGKVGFENAEADDTGNVTLVISAHMPFIPLRLIVHPEVHKRSRKNTYAVHGGSSASPAYCTSVLRKSQIVLLRLLVLTPCVAQEREEVYRLDTPDYRIEMNVKFFAPYLGKRLVFYNSQNPGKE